MLLTSSNNCVPGSLKWADPRCHPRVGYNSSLPDEKTGHCSSEAKSTFRRLPISSHVLSPSKQSVKSETLDMSDLFPGPDSGHVGCCRTFFGVRGGIGPYCAKLVTLMTSAVFSAMARSRFEIKKPLDNSPRSHQEIGLQTVAVWRVPA